MKYKTTYFPLSVNKNITNSDSKVRDMIHREEIISEIKELEKQLEEAIQKQLVYWYTTKTDKRRQLTANEKKEVLRHFQFKDINEWQAEVELSKIRERLSFKEVLRSTEVKKLKELMRRLDNIKDPLRFTKKDEADLNLHLSASANEGWRLHSMKSVSKGLWDWRLGDHSGAGYGHDIQEGFLLIWEKED